jgi:hypothetical protein
MPPQQSLGLDEEASASSNREQSAQSSENCSIRRLKRWADHLPAQYGNLVAEKHDFNGQVLLLAT